MSLNQIWNITLGSMRNNQYALTVVSQNMANIHTPGYYKQRVNFATNRYTTKCRNVIETIKGMNGAHVDSLSNYVDKGLLNSVLNSNSDAQYYNNLADALQGLEDIADDLGDNGLNALLNDFYKASANLEQMPADMTIRQQFVMSAQNVCEKFNEISKKYDSLQQDKLDTVSNTVSEINSLFDELATYNEALSKNPGDSSIQSSIDAILQELSNYMDVSTDQNANGTYNVYVGNTKVVSGNEVKYTLETNFDASNPDKTLSFSLRSTENPDYVIEKGVNEAFTSGALKAQLDFLNGSGKGFSNINDMKKALNSAASAFAKAMNAIQTYSDGNVFAANITTDAEGNLILERSTHDFFTSLDGKDIDASNITVNPDIVSNPFLVAAARIDLDKYTPEEQAQEAWKNAIGNSDNATQITALQNAKICSYGDGVNNCTLSQFLINNAAKNGMDASNIISKAETFQDIADSDLFNFQNLTGVNLDEELADMLRYQRAFEASARLFSTVDELMQTIIGMV